MAYISGEPALLPIRQRFADFERYAARHQFGGIRRALATATHHGDIQFIARRQITRPAQHVARQNHCARHSARRAADEAAS